MPTDLHIPTATRPLTPEREELIRRAVEVHREKSQILDDPPEELRDRLTALALRTYLHPPPPKKRQN